MPKAVLSSLLSGATGIGQVIGVLNLSPYDAWLESVCLKWGPRTDRDLRTLSVSGNLNYVQFSQKQCALILLEDLSFFGCAGDSICSHGAMGVFKHMFKV